MDICIFKQLLQSLCDCKVRQRNEVPAGEIWRSLNATIVGLAVSNASEARSIPYCVGLGIVRGIDVQKGLLYVITPVPLERLQSVDLLQQGLIEIPTTLLQVRGCVSPYMSTNVLHKISERDFLNKKKDIRKRLICWVMVTASCVWVQTPKGGDQCAGGQHQTCMCRLLTHRAYEGNSSASLLGAVGLLDSDSPRFVQLQCQIRHLPRTTPGSECNCIH